MNRINKTKNNYEKIWRNLDTAYESMENAINMLSSMVGLPDELASEVDNFDIFSISSIKQHVENMIEQSGSRYFEK